MVILANVYAGMVPDRVAELFRDISAFAVQTADGLGGIRGVALLAVVGFVVGLVACMIEIKTISR